VHDALQVKRLDGEHEFTHEQHQIARRAAMLADVLRERLALDVLPDEPGVLPVLPHSEEIRDADVGEVWISANDAKVLKNDLHINRVD